MARKKPISRPNIPQETLNRARRQAGQEGTFVIEEEKPRERPAPKARPEAPLKKVTMDDLADEYAYVVTDLRNMAVLASALFVLLVILALTL